MALSSIEANWRFENDWTDASGNGINGSSLGGAGFSSSIKKVDTYSSKYDGTDDAGNFLNSLNSVFAGADKKFSFAFWIYLNNLTTVQGAITKNGDGSQGENQRQFFTQVRTDGLFRFRVYFDLGAGSIQRTYDTPISTISAGGWHLIRVNYDGSIDTNDGDDRVTIKVDNVNQTLTVSRNGALGDIQTGTARLATGGFIGSSGSTIANDLNGYMDEAGVRSVLFDSTDDDSIWNSGAGRRWIEEIPAGLPFFFGIDDKWVI